MTNVAGPFGLKPLRYRSGAPYNDAATLYYTTQNLFIGDPVVITTSAMSADYYGNPAGSLRTVTRATPGTTNPITGVVVGFFAEQATSPVYNPASTARGVYVADDPNLIYAIQDDGSATPTYLFAGHNAYLVTGTGSTATGLSGFTLSASTAAASQATWQLTIIRFRPIVGNTMAAYAQWEVAINASTEVNQYAGV
jgi:hypothetical protein